MQERFYESGSCVQKNCAILGVHPKGFRPTSVQFKGRINSDKARKRHQTRHLEFYTPQLLTEGLQIRPTCATMKPLLTAPSRCWSRLAKAGTQLDPRRPAPW